MSKSLRVLVVEDSEEEAARILQEVRRGGYAPIYARVNSPTSMKAALAEGRWDVVIAANSMAGFNGLDALELSKKNGFDGPFIMVSRSFEESAVVTALRAGARDCVSQGRLERLVPAVERGLAEVRARRGRCGPESELLRLEKSNKIKSVFLNVMSHELRTPLNMVMGYASMVQDRVFGEINQEQEKAVGKILRHANDLLTMINSIMAASRIEAGAVEVEERAFQLGPFLDELKSVYDLPLDREPSLTWDYPSDLPVVKTDSGKLRQVLQNLINNALRFTSKGRVTISARWFPDSRTVQFKVADTGIGIPKEAFPFILEMFRRVDGADVRVYSGIGLGLHIVKTFTEMLGGRVDFESEPGKGSTFMVTIPIQG